MLQQGAWTFRYSLEGFLKRLFHVSAGPRTESELVEAVLGEWAGEDEKSRETIPDRVRASLRAKFGAFIQLDDGRFALKTSVGDELQDLAYEFLKQSGCPQKNGEFFRHLQTVTGRGRGELMSRLDLDSDPRFARLEGGEWLLTEWELANEAIANLMIELGQRRASREDLLALIEDDGSNIVRIFHPELDPRFALVDNLVECLLVEAEAAATATTEQTHTEQTELDKPEKETEESQMNATATFETTTTNDTIANVTTSQLVDFVLSQLTQASTELQHRNLEIPNEVMALFNNEDLEGIQALMSQRKRIESLASDLQALVTKWKEDGGEL
ncbi:MAG: hypothetical protein ACXVP5_10890 [Tumebacillaceae bacterium]